MDGDFQEAALDLVSMFQEEIAPKSWWGTLLVDATELLKLSECDSNIGSTDWDPDTNGSMRVRRIDVVFLFWSCRVVEALRRSQYSSNSRLRRRLLICAG